MCNWHNWHNCDIIWHNCGIMSIIAPIDIIWHNGTWVCLWFYIILNISFLILSHLSYPNGARVDFWFCSSIVPLILQFVEAMTSDSISIYELQYFLRFIFISVDLHYYHKFVHSLEIFNVAVPSLPSWMHHDVSHCHLSWSSWSHWSSTGINCDEY
jgi:hypothetical protein